MKIKIENFQSIKSAELEFPVGITVITGSSNSGKTAVMRAIQSAISNPRSGKHFIRHSDKNASVTIYDGLNEIEWIRGENTISYLINGQKYDKCGKSDLWSFLPNYSIKKEPEGSIFNFHGEYDSLFPFRFTSGELFSVFERIVSLDDTASVFKAIQGDLSSLSELKKQDKRVLEDKSKVVAEEKSIINELYTQVYNINKDKDDKDILISDNTINDSSCLIDLIVKRLLMLFDSLKKKKEEIQLLENNLLSLYQIRDKVSVLSNLNNMSYKDFLNKYSFLANLISNLINFKKQYSLFNNLNNLLSRYDGVSSISSLNNFSSVESLCNNIINLKEKLKKVITTDNKINYYRNILLTNVTNTFLSIDSNYLGVKKFVELKDNIVLLLKRLNFFENIPKSNVFFKYENINYDDISSKINSIEKINRISIEISNNFDKSDKIKKQMEDLSDQLKSFKVCPLCNRSF